MPDKPAEIIEISDALGRDVDKARAGKLKHDLPVEAFMSEQAIEQVAAETAAAAAPVHAEDLKPITRAEAARRETFDGEHLPSGLPRMKRVIPAPYRRDRIDISHHGRTWQPCRAGEVQVGDTVPGIGEVVKAEPVIRYETVAGVPDVAIGMKVKLTGKGGIVQAFDPGDQLRAHRVAELCSKWRICAAGSGSRPTGTGEPA
jgi:hypothetical protein